MATLVLLLFKSNVPFHTRAYNRLLLLLPQIIIIITTDYYYYICQYYMYKNIGRGHNDSFGGWWSHGQIPVKAMG